MENVGTDAGLAGNGTGEGNVKVVASGKRVEVGSGVVINGVAVCVAVGVFVSRGTSFRTFRSEIKTSCEVPS